MTAEASFSSFRVGLFGTLFLGLVMFAGCTPDPSTTAETVTTSVCSESQREFVLEDHPRGTWELSTPFTVSAGGDYFVAVLADTMYNPNGIGFWWVANLFIIPAGTEPNFEPGLAGTRVSLDTRIEFDEIGAYQPMTVAPGDYQIYSNHVPLFRVVRCP